MQSPCRSFDALREFAAVASEYRYLRERHPHVAASLVFAYILAPDDYLTLEQFVCARTVGHVWTCTGTAGGGDDPRFHGEGRMLCSNCGADGDA